MRQTKLASPPQDQRGLRQRKSEATRLRIAQEGLRLFTNQGYEQVTLESVARAADISARTLYHYFETKFDILLFFHDEGFVREIEPTMLGMDATMGPYRLARDCLLALIPKYETDTLLATYRIWQSTDALVAQKQLKFLQIETAITATLGKIWPAPTSQRSFEMIGMAMAGTLRLAMDADWQDSREHSATYGPGNAGLTQSFETTRMTWQALEPDNQFETLHLYLSGTIIAEVAEEYRRIGTPHIDRPLSALVFRGMMIGTVAGEVLNAVQQEASGIYAEQVARFLAAHLLARHSRWWNPDDDTRQPPLLGDLTLAELAGEACISVHHFVCRFREQMGVTPFAYLTMLRLEAGKRMLRTSDMTVAEIAHLCGYTSPGSFSSTFRREVGSTPRDYRSTTRLRSDRD
jgi:AraC family transcriptional regulator